MSDIKVAERLRQRLRGEVVSPVAPDYEKVRAIWNGQIIRRPAQSQHANVVRPRAGSERRRRGGSRLSRGPSAGGEGELPGPSDRLAGHPRVAKVNYPGRATGSRAEIVARQMNGGGGILSFVVDGDAAQTAAMVDRLRLISLAASLGGVESLACQPALLTHRSLTPDERKRRGIDDSMVRLSVGLEDPADLMAALDGALA